MSSGSDEARRAHMTVIRPTPFRTMFFGGEERPPMEMVFRTLAIRPMEDQWNVEVFYQLSSDGESFDGRAIWSPVKGLATFGEVRPHVTVVIGDHRQLPRCLEDAVVEAVRSVMLAHDLTTKTATLHQAVSLLSDGGDYECRHSTWTDLPE